MSENLEFQDGWDFIVKYQTSFAAGNAGAVYVESVSREVEKLAYEINNMSYGEIDKLKGNIAEAWHSGTFNIDAAVKGSGNRSTVLKSNKFASVDVQLDSGEKYGLKYDATAENTMEEQAKSFFERYMKYADKCKKRGIKPPSYEKYLTDRGFDPNCVTPNDPIYSGQYRLVPSDQFEEIQKLLKRKISEESSKRPELAKKYQDTLNMLKNKIEDSNGNKSIPLTKNEAEELARLAKEGRFDPSDWGLVTEELIKYKYILQESLKAGTSAATLTLAFKLAPEIYKAIDYLIKNGELNADDLKKTGIKVISASAESFLRGSISSAITIACKAGKLGLNLKNVNSSIVSAVTVIAFETFKNSCQVACGKMTIQELEIRLTKDILISSSSFIGGAIGQAILYELPVIGYTLGSIIGSVVGSIAVNGSEKIMLSFCADTGYTLFGLVEQNYEMPKEVFDRLGIETVDFKISNIKKVSYQTVSYKRVDLKQLQLQYTTLGFEMLKRGIIGVNKIGYV